MQTGCLWLDSPPSAAKESDLPGGTNLKVPPREASPLLLLLPEFPLCSGALETQPAGRKHPETRDPSPHRQAYTCRQWTHLFFIKDKPKSAYERLPREGEIPSTVKLRGCLKTKQCFYWIEPKITINVCMSEC